MGTLVAFIVVSAGVMILRKTRPDMQRGFRVPFYPVLPILSIVACFWLIYNLNPTVFKLFAIWLVFAAIFYFAYSARNSRLEKKAAVAAAARS
jgi:APA family basic amino acid/polyamine antiporter